MNNTTPLKKNYTREHFALVAAVIASVADVDTRKVLCEEWSLKLAKTNRRFNFGTFAKACDVSQMEMRETTLREPLWMEELAKLQPTGPWATQDDFI